MQTFGDDELLGAELIQSILQLDSARPQIPVGSCELRNDSSIHVAPAIGHHEKDRCCQKDPGTAHPNLDPSIVAQGLDLHRVEECDPKDCNQENRRDTRTWIKVQPASGNDLFIEQSQRFLNKEHPFWVREFAALQALFHVDAMLEVLAKRRIGFTDQLVERCEPAFGNGRIEWPHPG
ncbi:MAG: hypothetical protein IT449_10835 [Phycisphaerales bacterium]|nr:hypothetical protein [Phycisphaerales bacterium]